MIPTKAERFAEFQDKFAIDDELRDGMTGSFVLKADALSKRFDDNIAFQTEALFRDERLKTFPRNDDMDICVGSFGNTEWSMERRLWTQCYTVLALGKRPPTRMLCRVYAEDALDRWVVIYQDLIGGEK